VKEHARLGGLLDGSGASLCGVLETLRQVDAGIPWDHPHPELSMRQLAEEISYDAAELGEKPPALQQPPRFDNELGELIALSRKLAGRLEYLHAAFRR
jgi:hypothetical protein